MYQAIRIVGIRVGKQVGFGMGDITNIAGIIAGAQGAAQGSTTTGGWETLVPIAQTLLSGSQTPGVTPAINLNLGNLGTIDTTGMSPEVVAYRKSQKPKPTFPTWGYFAIGGSVLLVLVLVLSRKPKPAVVY